jgi:hypothetical protein
VGPSLAFTLAADPIGGAVAVPVMLAGVGFILWVRESNTCPASVLSTATAAGDDAAVS